MKQLKKTVGAAVLTGALFLASGCSLLSGGEPNHPQSADLQPTNSPNLFLCSTNNFLEKMQAELALTGTSLGDPLVESRFDGTYSCYRYPISGNPPDTYLELWITPELDAIKTVYVVAPASNENFESYCLAASRTVASDTPALLLQDLGLSELVDMEHRETDTKGFHFELTNVGKKFVFSIQASLFK